MKNEITTEKKGRLLPAVPGLVHILGVPNCFAPDRRFEGVAPAFRTLLDIKRDVCALAKVPQWWSRGGKLFHNGVQVPIADWGRIYAAPGDSIEFVAMPAGKVGNILMKVVGAIMQVVGAIVSCIPDFQPLGMGLMAAGAAITIAADFICPIKPHLPSSDDKAASPTYSLNSSSNQMGYDTPIPRIYGRFKVPPRRIIDDYTELDGNDEYLNFLAVVGYGPLQIEDWRIGGNPIENYDGVTMEVTPGVSASEQTSLVKTVAYQSGTQVQLTGRDSDGNEIEDHEEWWVVRSVNHEVDKISFDLICPNGIYKLNDNGDKESSSVEVEYQYCISGTKEWVGQQVTIPATTIDIAERQRNLLGTWYIYVLNRGIAYDYKNHGDLLVTVVGTADWTGKRMDEDEPTVSLSVTYNDKNIAKYGMTVTQTGPAAFSFSAATYSDTKGAVTLYSNKANPGTAVRKTVSLNVARYGLQEWDIRVRRKTVESTDSKYQQTVYLGAVRGINTKEKTYSGDKALCRVAMRIKATNQLSNSLGVVTCIATSVLPDWDKTKGKWVNRATRNPASIFLDILRGSANERPKANEQIDFDSLEAWHEWCDQYGYTCDLVFDTQTNVWDALCEVASAGRGSPSLIGGKWGVVWAHKQTQVVGHVTARNTANFNSSRKFLSELHGLKVTFFDEDEDYEENQIIVYAPGYNKSNASLFESISLTGVTNRTLAAYTGQFRLNQVLLLGEEYTCTMPLEFLRLRKNDLVRVVRPEVMYGIGAAWVTGYKTNSSGRITELSWDSQLDITNGESYMAVVRLGDGSELSMTGIAIDGKSMKMTTPVAATLLPRVRDLVMLGTYKQVGRLCIVTSIKPKEKLTAVVSLQDYVDALYENDGGTVPAYDPCITLTGSVKYVAKAPTIENVRSDEWALRVVGDEVRPRIYVAWRFEDDSTKARVEYRVKRSGEDPEPWTVAGVYEAKSCYIEDVEEGYTTNASAQTREANGTVYDIRVQAIDGQRGTVSAWTTRSNHAVVGRTSFPTTVSGLKLAIQNPEGIKATWTALSSKDVVKYVISGIGSAVQSSVNSAILRPKSSGTLTAKIVAEDVLGLRSKTSSSASITVHKPATPAPEYENTKTGGIITWDDCKTDFDIAKYMVEDVYAGTNREYRDPEFRITPRPVGVNYTFKVKAVDLFGNVSEEASYGITIAPMSQPKPKATIEGRQVVISWAAINSPFEIDHFEVRETSNRIPTGTVKGTVFRAEAAPLVKFGSSISLASMGYNFQVKAVDIAGNVSPVGECALSIKQPSAPKGIAAAVDGDRIRLSWTEVASSLPIVGFDVVRQWDEVGNDGVTRSYEEDYGLRDSRMVYLPPLRVGSYDFMVRSVDSAGNRSAWATCQFDVKAPGKVTSQESGATVNNVMIYYTDPDYIFFPIREYAVFEVDSNGDELEIGRTDTNFFAEVKDVGGDYTYRIYPVDVADNFGLPETITIHVQDPAGLIVYHNFDSLLNGTKTNFLLDGRGSMIGPVNANLKWTDTDTEQTWSQRVSAKNTSWLSPGVTTATYRETVSINMTIPSSYSTITVTSRTLAGAPTVKVYQKASADNTTWTEEVEGSKAKFEGFAYLQFRVVVTGGIVAISNIHIDIEVQQLEDSGVSQVYAADCYGTDGKFHPGDRIGTWIPFFQNFFDVNTPVTVEAVDRSTGLNPFAVFDDVANPTGFRAILLDKTGTPIDGKVKWSVTGV